METLIVKSVREIKKILPELEEKLKVKIAIKGLQITLTGEPLDEYEAMGIFDAIGFGFSPKVALMLKEEDVMFRKVSIRHITNRKNISIIKARLIGTNGKTKKTIEHLADCRIVVNDNEVGIIGPTAEMEEATTAIENLIRGSKQGNVYNYLERKNRERK